MSSYNRGNTRGYGPLDIIIVGGCLIGALAFGKAFVKNVYEWHKFDKNVTKYVEVANSAMSAAKGEGITSMEESLTTAADNSTKWAGKNTAIIWKTPYSEVDNFTVLAQTAAKRCREIGQLESALKTGEVPEGSSDWVVTTAESLTTKPEDGALVRRLAYSEQGQTIASSYEAVNDVVAGGGIRVTGEKADSEDRSLVSILDTAGGFRSMIRFQARDYKEAAAEVKTAVIYANLGCLDESVACLKRAGEIMDKYPDSKNLAIWRGTVTMDQGTLKRSIKSAVSKLEEINMTDPSLKYSAGWWDRVSKFTESVGGHEVPCLTDLGNNISGAYSRRAMGDLLGLLPFLFVLGACCSESRYY